MTDDDPRFQSAGESATKLAHGTYITGSGDDLLRRYANHLEEETPFSDPVAEMVRQRIEEASLTHPIGQRLRAEAEQPCREPI